MGYRYYRYGYNRNRYAAVNQISDAPAVNNEQLRDPQIANRISQLQGEATLTTWEKEFLDSIKKFFDKKLTLTSGQYQTFAKIEKRFDPAIVSQTADWFNNYTQEMHDDVHLLAKIYKNAGSPYFRPMIEKVLNNPAIKLSKSEYEKFVKTKYAEGYLNNARCEPRFAIGDTVSPSARFQDSTKRFLAAIVIDNQDQLPHTYSDGGKRYLILPYGSTQTMVVDERELKYFKQK